MLLHQILGSGTGYQVDRSFDEIGHRLLRRCLKRRIQDEQLLDLITKMLRCGIWEDGTLTYPTRGTPQGAIVSPLLANVCLHEFDEWYVRTYRVRPEWAHLSPSSLQYRRKKELGGTLMLTRYADDWVGIWNGSRERAEEIKAEIKTFFADQLQLRLSEEKTLITHIDDGFDFLGYRLQGDKRWSDGQWCLFSAVPEKAVRRFRDQVETSCVIPSRMKSPPSRRFPDCSEDGATIMPMLRKAA